MDPIKCPSCGSPNVEFLPGNFARCGSCGTAFATGVPQQQYYAPPLPQDYAAHRSANLGVVIAVGIVICAVIILGAAGAGFLLYAKSSSVGPAASPRASTHSSGRPVISSSSSEEPGKGTSSPVDVGPPPSSVTTAEYRDVRRATVSGSLIWIGKYVNTGETAIVRPSVVVSLFDQGGKRIAEQPGYSADQWLEPGEWCILLVLASAAPEYAREEVKVVKPQAPSYDTKPVDLKLVEWGTAKGSFNGIDAVGTVRNDSKKNVRFAQIVIYGFDGQGQPVSVSSGYATESDLAAGAESGFKVSITSLKIGDATRYSAIAFASPE